MTLFQIIYTVLAAVTVLFCVFAALGGVWALINKPEELATHLTGLVLGILGTLASVAVYNQLFGGA